MVKVVDLVTREIDVIRFIVFLLHNRYSNF